MFIALYLVKNLRRLIEPEENDPSYPFGNVTLFTGTLTGYEWEGQKIWMNYLKPYVDNFITDSYGSAVGVIIPKAKYKVVIEGQADEISWYVNYISDFNLTINYI